MTFKLSLISEPVKPVDLDEESTILFNKNSESVARKNLITLSTEKYINELPVDLQQSEFDRINQEATNENTLLANERLESYEEACARLSVECTVQNIVEHGIVRQKVPK